MTRPKRKVGERSKVLFDNIDFEIMALLVKEQPISVLELAKKLGNIKHANLKKHLDKLEEQHLIIRKSVPKSRKIEIWLNDKVYTKEVVRGLIKILDKVSQATQ